MTLIIIEDLCHLCGVSFMLSVIYTEFHLYRVPFIQSVIYTVSFILSVIYAKCDKIGFLVECHYAECH